MFGTLTDIEGSLFSPFRRIDDALDELLDGWSSSPAIRAVARGTFPPINVGVTADQVHVYVFVPGVDPKNVDLSVQENLLTIAGTRGAPANEDPGWYRKERFDGAFRRVLALPDDVLADRAQAAYRDGVLHITIARKESAKPRQIDVKAA